ncbi:beta-galactosidase [Microbacterium barkeri]|uniref:beta-galactosidase n=1 Tax=Microbacterium barkeri TaxID=33917 RepID=UPI0024AFCA9E|nr:beta-galactosidase [Microbacterium barkeri]MDI6942831.1 beta-galactosidase [Microbacterium barkeri]
MQTHRWLRTPEGTTRRISYGADYNPEQWPREVWDEDVRLMREAGVDVVSVGIFSWAKIQPAEDTWDFAWLDEVIDLLHANGIGVDLATATASPPPWLTIKHPEVLPVTHHGHILSPGARQHWRPTSPVFRGYALRLVEALAERYRDHPALVAWHVNNELGCHNAWDYSDDAARAFRGWLERRYGTIERLNHAWGTAFWSQQYGSFSEILPPREVDSHPNPTQQLDFKRFSSDALKEHFIAERDLLRRITPDIPITTNFMVMGETQHADYADWAHELDFVSNDHYRHPGPQSYDELAFSAALVSGISHRRPWFLMEHSTSAVNWQSVNRPKREGELVRDSLTHVAHGADAVCYFQWRQSAAGAEKYHSAMVPHAGPDSRVFRSVVELGATLRRLDDIAGAEAVPAPVAILFDWDSWWGSELDSHPTELLRYRQEALDWWTALRDAGVRVDVVPADVDLSSYRLVIAPVLYAVPAALAETLAAYVEAGGHLVTTYFSGAVNEDDRAWLGGYPGAFRELLGVRVEEFRPLYDGETIRLDSGAIGTLWSEPVDLVDPGVEVLARYAESELDGSPAVTRRAVGAGSAAYVSTRLGAEGLGTIVPALLEGAGVESELPEALRGRAALTLRGSDGARFAFVLNRTDDELPLDGVAGAPLLGGETLPPRGVAVFRQE